MAARLTPANEAMSRAVVSSPRIASRPGDLDGALVAYERRMRPFVRWSHTDASAAMLKRWAPMTARQVRMNALIMRTVTRTPLRRLLTRADRPPLWDAA